MLEIDDIHQSLTNFGDILDVEIIIVDHILRENHFRILHDIQHHGGVGSSLQFKGDGIQFGIIRVFSSLGEFDLVGTDGEAGLFVDIQYRFGQGNIGLVLLDGLPVKGNHFVLFIAVIVCPLVEDGPHQHIRILWMNTDGAERNSLQFQFDVIALRLQRG